MDRELVTAIADLEEEKALCLVEESLNKGEDPNNVMGDCQEAMRIVGDRYEKEEYFLPELLMSGKIVERISKIVQPKMEATVAKSGRKLATVVIGSVHGDVHDLGKNIVSLMLEASGYEVHDLGVDVPEEKFVEAIREKKPQIVALSGYLTLAFDSMKSTIQAIDRAGLRKNVKVMIGGGLVTEKVKDYSNADGWGQDAAAAIRLAKGWLGG